MFFSVTSSFSSLPVVIPAFLAAYVCYYLCWIVYSRLFHPYHDIPGPFLASISSWWRWYAVRYSIEGSLHHRIHERYGPLVRIAPDEVSVSDPHALDMIARPDFLKTEFYDNFNPGIGGRPEPFAEQNERIHTQHKKIIAPLFRSDVILEYEGYVETILDVFDQRMTEFSEKKAIFDLAEYVNRFTWDTIGDMVYSKAGGFGMLRGEGYDYMGWMQMIRVMPQPISSMALCPVWAEKFLPSPRPRLQSSDEEGDHVSYED